QHPEQAVLDARLPDRVRGRAARADPRLQALAAAGRHGDPRVHPASHDPALATEDHVERMREVYAAKRDLFLEFFAGKGIRVAGSAATFYLWCQTPEGETSAGFGARLLEQGVVVAPGSFLGDAGEGYFRLALVPTLEECRLAVD